mmetsp:Transcript_25860/g.48559  ORF Transcript_25860/g.48559 Transcript_25860/m.48559 type:complete len:267 (+) Transcript_25860:1169-1969(+)
MGLPRGHVRRLRAGIHSAAVRWAADERRLGEGKGRRGHRDLLRRCSRYGGRPSGPGWLSRPRAGGRDADPSRPAAGKVGGPDGQAGQGGEGSTLLASTGGALFVLLGCHLAWIPGRSRPGPVHGDPDSLARGRLERAALRGSWANGFAAKGHSSCNTSTALASMCYHRSCSPCAARPLRQMDGRRRGAPGFTPAQGPECRDCGSRSRGAGSEVCGVPHLRCPGQRGGHAEGRGATLVFVLVVKPKKGLWVLGHVAHERRVILGRVV